MTPPQGAGYQLRNRLPFFAPRGGELDPNFVLKLLASLKNLIYFCFIHI